MPVEFGAARFGGAPIVCAALVDLGAVFVYTCIRGGKVHSGAEALAGLVFTWGRGFCGCSATATSKTSLCRELAGQFDGRKTVMLVALGQATRLC